MPGNKVAVLTGDIIASTAIPEEKRPQMLACLKQVTRDAQQFLEDFEPEIFQGDSFQGHSHLPAMSLKTALYMVIVMLEHGFGLRISVATGSMSFDSGQSLTSDGTAFRLSGRNLEQLKKNDQVIAVSSENDEMNEEWLVHSATLNHLLKRCTSLQAQAIAEMIKGKTQTEAAILLQIKQPAVQQRLQAAGWPLMQTILDRFESQF